MKGFPLEFGISTRVKNYSDGATGPSKKFDDIFSHLDAIHKCVRERDRRLYDILVHST